MNIIKGIRKEALKIVVYGPEGIGKSTFASKFPEPLFIDTEGSTTNMDVARTEKPSSFQMLLQQIKYIKENPSLCRTLVIDTADWAEKLCIEEFCAVKQITGIEDIGYGRGYVYIAEDFGRLLNALDDVRKQGINIVVTAHAQMRKFEQPEELGAYDRWELKLQKKTAPLLKEWADMVLFANYKTIVINVDNQGAQKGKNKAQGGKRVMYTQHHPCWDAKNRHGLSAELPFEYSAVAHCIPVFEGQSTPVAPAPTASTADHVIPAHVATPQSQAVQPVQPVQPKLPVQEQTNQAPQQTQQVTLDPKIPTALAELMKQNNVTETEIQKAVAGKGYYPINTPIWNYDPNFINGCLVAAWSQVFEIIKKNRN